jgi:long-chain acyl-CoA synthetase
VTEVAPSPQAEAEVARRPRTIGRLWRDAIAANHARSPYLVETADGWREVSWDEAVRRVDDLAFGLVELGIGRGDAVAIVARTALEWSLVDFAVALIGGITTAVYPTSTADECRYLLEHTDCVAAIVEDEEQRTKIEDVRTALPQLRSVLTFADLDGLEASGRRYREAAPQALAEAEAAVGEDDVFTYIFTSGTTGPPKACVIRHRNYYAMTATVDRLEDFLADDDVMLLWLPLAHNFGRCMHLAGPYTGFTIAFCADPYRVGEVLPHTRPTILPSSPRLYEKVYAAVTAQFESAAGLRRRIVNAALATGYRVSRLRQEGKPLPPVLALRHRLADRLVYSKVKRRLGGRLRFGISGAAPLAREVAEFFHALDILILEGYGLTECTTACSVNRIDRYKFGTVGPALPGFEIQIADDGEILIRSETIFAGYLKDDQATREILTEDGWLRSGDVGTLDEDGFLTITDRKKDILVTAGGKNVAPQNIENALKSAKLISQVVVVGDRQPFLVALVTLDEDQARTWAQARGIGGDVADVARDERLRAEIERAVDDANRRLARFEQIKRFAILPRDFSADNDELTPTMKLRRRVVERNFAAEIADLYR